MAFSDLFKPRWQHPDPQVRLRAAQKLKDGNIAQAVFAELAKNRELAKLYGPGGASQFRLEAIAELTDETVLAELAQNRNETSPEVRLRAAKKLSNRKIAQLVFADLAKRTMHPIVSVKAVLSLEDKDLLAQIARNSSLPGVRLAAAIKLTSPSFAETMYADFAKTDTDDWSGMPDMMDVVVKLGNEQILAEIAKEDPNQRVRAAAARKLQDQKLIADVLKAQAGPKEEYTPSRGGDPVVWDMIREAESRENESRWESWRQEFCDIVLTRVTDQALLADIAKNARERDLQKAATSKINDPLLLADIAKNQRDSEIRRAAGRASSLTFIKYTDKASRVLFFSHYEAAQLGSPYTEPDHLLLGLLHEDGDLFNRFLPSAGTVDSIRNQVMERTTIRENRSTLDGGGFGTECMKLLAYAAEEAKELRHEDVRTDHLLLGLLHQENGLVSEILRERGLKLSVIREELRKGPSGHKKPF